MPVTTRSARKAAEKITQEQSASKPPVKNQPSFEITTTIYGFATDSKLGYYKTFTSDFPKKSGTYRKFTLCFNERFDDDIKNRSSLINKFGGADISYRCWIKEEERECWYRTNLLKYPSGEKGFIEDSPKEKKVFETMVNEMSETPKQKPEVNKMSEITHFRQCTRKQLQPGFYKGMC